MPFVECWNLSQHSLCRRDIKASAAFAKAQEGKFVGILQVSSLLVKFSH